MPKVVKEYEAMRKSKDSGKGSTGKGPKVAREYTPPKGSQTKKSGKG